MAGLERRMEREMRDVKEQMREWKVKMQLERGKREAVERKMMDLEGDVEILKGKLKEERRERERMSKILGEMRESMRREESKIRRERERKGTEEDKRKVRSEVRVVNASKRKRTEDGRSKVKVWDRGLILHRGVKWNEETDLQDWLEAFLEGTGWEVEDTANEETKKIIFSTKEEMEEIWRRRRKVNEEGHVRLEQWMTMEERRAKKEAMLIRERKVEEEKGRGEAAKMEKIRVIVEGKEYEWVEEEERIRKVKTEERKDEEEERAERKKKED